MNTDTLVETKPSRKTAQPSGEDMKSAAAILSELDSDLAQADLLSQEIGASGQILGSTNTELDEPVPVTPSAQTPTDNGDAMSVAPTAAPTATAQPKQAPAPTPVAVNPRVESVARRMVRERGKSIAQIQRERGSEQLARDYLGAMIVRRNVKVYDVKLASSLERYLAYVDLALYQLARSGPSILGSNDTFDLLERFDDMITTHSNDAKQALDTTALLLTAEKGKFFDESKWLTPAYTSATVAVEVKMKHPLTRYIITGIEDYEGALTNLNVLQWNVKIDPAQSTQVRDEHDRAIRAIFRFATSVFTGLRRRVDVTPTANQKGVPALFKPVEA
jgi:hypothetical protein